MYLLLLISARIVKGLYYNEGFLFQVTPLLGCPCANKYLACSVEHPSAHLSLLGIEVAQWHIDCLKIDV